MMNDLPGILLAAGGGVVAGGVFFGGLYLTVEKGLISEKPAMVFVLSLVMRSALVLVVFFLTMNGSPLRLLFSLLGFIAARIIVGRLIRPSSPPSSPRKEDPNEHKS